AIDALSNGQSFQNSSVLRVENDRGCGVVAKGEENVVLDIQAKAGGSATFAFQVVGCKDLHRIDVHDGNFVFVFQSDIQSCLTVTRRLLGGAAEIDCANDRSLFGVNHRGIGRDMAENVNSFGGRFEKNSVGPALHRNGFDGLQAAGV